MTHDTHPETPNEEVATRLTDARVLSFILGLVYLTCKLVIHPILNMYLVWDNYRPLIEFPPLETLDVLLLVAMPMGLSAFNTLLNKVAPK
tara:strand:- start:3246 stop:3515 length:270 start_codon:yes stop_codon:yes gene_type:complete